MEKEPKPFLGEEAKEIMEAEGLEEMSRADQDAIVKNILKKTKTRILSDAELIQKGAKLVLDDGTENPRLEISKKSLQEAKREMAENLSPKDNPRILKMIKKLGIRGNRWISDEEFIKRKELKEGRSLGAWEELYKGEKHYVMGDIIKIKCKNGKVFKGRIIEEEEDEDDKQFRGINDNMDEAAIRLLDDRISIDDGYNDEKEVLFNDIEDIIIVKKDK